MSSSSLSATRGSVSASAALAPVVAAVFLGFLAVSLPLAAIPIEVGDRLGFGALTIGCVIGLQSVATLLTRHNSGTFSDRRGPRMGVLVGLPIAAGSGLILALAASLPLSPAGRLVFIMLGRIVMGLGESLFLTGLMSWGIARAGAARTGTVMSWTGIAIYAALGLGAPIGLAVQRAAGFGGVGLAVAMAPVLAGLLIVRLAPVPASGGQRVPFYKVLNLIWRPGVVLALATVPFATMAAFLVLDYQARGWPEAGSALFGFGAAYVLVRLVGSGLPDRLGASRVAAGSLAIETVGQVLLWTAPTATVALVGATLTGLGFSLVFPAMGVLATRAVPADQRGRAVGNFIAFADIAMAVTGPAVGVVTQSFGIGAAFLVGTLAAAGGLCLLPALRPSGSR